MKAKELASAESEEGRLRIKENTLPFDTYPTQRGLRVSHGWGSVRTNGMLGRYSSEIRTGCANQRPSGSVRGALSNECPYRDLKTSLCGSKREIAGSRQLTLA
jgi:hypothetical protein